MTSTNVAIVFSEYPNEDDKDDIKSDTRKSQFKYVTDLMRSADIMSECSWRETTRGKIILTVDTLLVPDISSILTQNDFTRKLGPTYLYEGYLFLS